MLNLKSGANALCPFRWGVKKLLAFRSSVIAKGRMCPSVTLTYKHVGPASMCVQGCQTAGREC